MSEGQEPGYQLNGSVKEAVLTVSFTPSPLTPIKLYFISLPFAGRSIADCLLPAGQAWYGRKLHASIPVPLPSYGSKHLWCEQPVKEIQLASICYVQICVYSSSYGDFLR